MPGSYRRLGRSAVFFALILLAGCGRKDPGPPVEVKGRVQRPDGKPVADMVLTFHPQEDTNKGNFPTVLADREGRFRALCLRGKYRVTIAPVPSGHGHADQGPTRSPGVVPTGQHRPDKYQLPERTPWEVTVPPEGKDDLVLTLEQ